jgi:hypothetical protein
VKWDFSDWFVLAHVNAAAVAATIFLFLYPVPTNFITWGTFMAALFSAYHWMLIRDAKQADAQ